MAFPSLFSCWLLRSQQALDLRWISFINLMTAVELWAHLNSTRSTVTFIIYAMSTVKPNKSLTLHVRQLISDSLLTLCEGTIDCVGHTFKSSSAIINGNYGSLSDFVSTCECVGMCRLSCVSITDSVYHEFAARGLSMVSTIRYCIRKFLIKPFRDWLRIRWLDQIDLFSL